jgi:hypothetical protein
MKLKVCIVAVLPFASLSLEIEMPRDLKENQNEIVLALTLT